MGKLLLHRIRLNAKEIVAGMGIIEGLIEKHYSGAARYQATIKRAMEQFSEDGPPENDTPFMPPI